ncbi:MAG: hypothetical protein JSR18_03000 [Proteobacteria bacterium]|nr:hypothetical protein [Pseudomonadota bacterium]
MILGIAGNTQHPAWRDSIARWQTRVSASHRGDAADVTHSAWFAASGSQATVGGLTDGACPVLAAWDGVEYRAGPPAATHVAACPASLLEDGATDGALARLNGDFRVATWHRAEHRIELATDAFAQRPLYFAWDRRADVLAFAGSTSLLRALPWVGAVVDDEVVVDLLLDANWPLERTPFRGIRFVPPGHRVEWRCGDGTPPRYTRYWRPRIAVERYRSRDEFVEAFRDDARAAVADRMRLATRGTAILMSGGYDSTAIAGIAATIGRSDRTGVAPAHTVSAVFAGLPCDESARISSMRAYTGLPGVDIDGLALALDVGVVERQVAATDFPLFNLQASLLDAQLDAAETLGCDLVLMGAGGDELATDVAYERDYFAQRGWLEVLQVARYLRPLRPRPASTLDVARALLRDRIPQRAKAIVRPARRWLAGRRPDPREAWLQPQWQPRPVRRAADVPGVAPIRLDGADHFQRTVWQNLQGAQTQFGQRVTAQDVLRRGLGYGAPLLDRRLFERVLGAEPQWLPRTHHAGQYKPLLAAAFRRDVAPGLMEARWKVEFGAYNRMLMSRALAGLRSWMDAGTWRSERFVSRHAAARMAEALQDSGGQADTLHRRLYSIIGTEAWLRHVHASGGDE